MSPQWSARGGERVAGVTRSGPGVRAAGTTIGSRAGRESRALVVHGEPGVGKTALLEHALAHTPGARIARAAGVQSEMELAYSGLHQLCVPLLEHAHRLPTHQHDALTTALGLHEGPPPNRFLVGLAVLGLLAEAARGQPLICLIDDAQWLDRASAQTLAFTARRLGAESVAMLFVTRRTSDIPELDGLPDLLLTGLPDHDARALLATALPGPSTSASATASSPRPAATP